MNDFAHTHDLPEPYTRGFGIQKEEIDPAAPHDMANIVELPKTVRIVTQAGYECPMIITPKDYLEKINV